LSKSPTQIATKGTRKQTEPLMKESAEIKLLLAHEIVQTWSVAEGLQRQQ
jgi:hypothetical protein